MTKEYLSIKEICDLLQITRQTLHNWTVKGIFPKPVKIGRRVYYLQSDINKLKSKLR